LYKQLQDQNFVVIAVALDSGGASAVRESILKANPTYPCLIDEKHILAELYDMVNVPNAVWINESGRIVRIAEPAGAYDYFREMDRNTFVIPQEALDESARIRSLYIKALQDWVEKGDSSEFALSPDQVRQRLTGPTNEHALATAYFRMGLYFDEQGWSEDAQFHFSKAKELRPESWNMKRQAWWFERTKSLKSSGPGFWEEVDALGEKPYYPQDNLADIKNQK
jgi:hypothetical protein